MTTKCQPMSNLLFFNFDLLQERINSDISLEEQYVRAYIAYRAGNGIPGKSCFASIETISKDLGYSKNTARKHIRFLVAAKHIIELGYRSEYGTKQYTLNQNYDDWIQISKNFRNAYNNIESIKSDKRKDNLNTSTVEAYFNPLSEVQNLNPNSLKEFNYEEKNKNSNFGTQQENYLATEVIETPIGEGFAPTDFPPPSPPSFASQTQESSDNSIDWGEYDLGFETSSNFGGSFDVPEPPKTALVLNPPGTIIEGATFGTWDDDFDDNVEKIEEAVPCNAEPSETFTQPALNTPARPGKSIFDITPDKPDELTLVEKLEVECEINNVAKEAETLKPEPEDKVDGRTSPLSQENKMLVLQVYGLEAAQYFDYPYLLLDFMNKKKEEWAKEKADKEAARRTEQYEQQIQQSQCTEPSEPVFVDDWADAPIADENNPNRPPFIPEPEPVAPSLPPAPGTPEYEEMCKNEVPVVGINIHNPQRIVEFLEQSNVFYNNNRRHYEVIMQEEVMDRFFPLFAELMKDRKNPIAFDKFIEMSLTMTAASMGWEDDRYFSGKVKSLIEPWIPSKFQDEKYSHFTKEELLDVARRDDIEWCEKLTFNDIMLQAEKVAFEAKEAGLSVEEYQKQQREEAAKVANEIAAKEEKSEELPDDTL